MPKNLRSLWSGTLSFGLINVPVDVFPATRRVAPSLRMLDTDGTPLSRRYVCPAHDRPVSADEIVRGYELEDGSYVTIRDEELEALEPKKSREIDLERFVDVADIPPLHFQRGYVLTPSGDSNKAYRLLAEVMESTGRAGIASVVMRGNEYVIAIMAEEGILRAETLRFQDEVRDPEEAGLDELPEADPDRVAEFEEAIDRLQAEGLDPDEMTDIQARRIRELAERKLEEGSDVVEPWAEAARGDEQEEGEEADMPEPRWEVDLLEAIRSGLQGEDGEDTSDPRAARNES